MTPYTVGNPKYLDLPELSPTHIVPNSGFSANDDKLVSLIDNLLAKKTTHALQYTEWLDEKNLLIQKGDYARNSARELKKRLDSLGKNTDFNRLARDILDIKDETLLSDDIIFARALQLISQDYPKLMVFRGAEYHEAEGYSGMSFAPFELEQAMPFVDGTRASRDCPVLVMASLSDIAASALEGGLTISSEGRWWRRSLDISPSPETATIYRIPSEGYRMKRILDTYKSVCPAYPSL